MGWQSKPVPSEGPLGAKAMLVGAYPGSEELKRGRPFVGKAGLELERYLTSVSIPREQLYITNLIKTGVGDVDEDDLDPASATVQEAAIQMRREIIKVQPEIIMTLGSLPTRALGIDEPLEACHGLLHPTDFGYSMLPAYNPAAGIRRASLMKLIEEDFEALGEVWSLVGDGGTVIPQPALSCEKPRDEHPIPVYLHLSDPGPVLCFLDASTCRSHIFIDTEGSVEEPWSVQFTCDPGEGFLILASDRAAVDALAEWIHYRKPTVVLHNSLHDIPVLRAMGINIAGTIDDQGFIDTMVMAYHLCDEPQGLKSLAYRHAGMKMRDYSQVVQPAQNALSRDYLEAVYGMTWPTVEPETVWRKGKLTRTKPWQIKRHAEHILCGYHGIKAAEIRRRSTAGEKGNDAVDLYARWAKVKKDHPEKTEIVEKVLGEMPKAGLQHIEFEDALRYACRDADATCRVYWKLKEKYKRVLKEEQDD